MDIVALVALTANLSSVEDEAPKLAVDLGITAYEAALLLRTPPPTIILRTDDRMRTLDVLAKVRARGHEVLACDLSAVVSSEDMFRPRSFRFEESSFVGIAGNEERRLPWPAVFALLRATHVMSSEETVVSRERKLSIGRTALTGGMLATKTTTKTTKQLTTDREPVLYVFHDEAPPWLLVSSHLRYEGLGEALAISKLENFEVLTTMLRARAPGATFDSRLVHARAAPTVVATSSKQVTSSSSAAVDVLAHVLALSVHRAKHDPPAYR